ncbi:MAG: hypothetical protein JNL98_02765 [Bryobacterales bacterium]|nr:hypothetical protein [Bryobacterales bacterium]
MRFAHILSLVLALDSMASAATLVVSPVSQNVALGSQAVFTVDIAGLGNGVAPSVGVFDFDILFDPAILSFSGVVFGNQLDILGLGSIQSATPGFGSVNLFELSLDTVADLNDLQSPAFILATLTFDTLANGVSPITINLNSLGDADGAAIAATITDGSVEVGQSTVVPEPAYWPLLALGLVTAVRFRKRG